MAALVESRSVTSRFDSVPQANRRRSFSLPVCESFFLILNSIIKHQERWNASNVERQSVLIGA